MSIPGAPGIGDFDSAPFWKACEARKLIGQRCLNCGNWRWPPREHCPDCHAPQHIWQDLPGTGSIVGSVVVRRTMNPDFPAPFAIVHVELDGTAGRMVLVSNLLVGQWPQARVGRPVAVRFTRGRSGRILPLFTIDYPKETAHHD